MRSPRALDKMSRLDEGQKTSRSFYPRKQKVRTTCRRLQSIPILRTKLGVHREPGRRYVQALAPPAAAARRLAKETYPRRRIRLSIRAPLVAVYCLSRPVRSHRKFGSSLSASFLRLCLWRYWSARLAAECGAQRSFIRAAFRSRIRAFTETRSARAGGVRATLKLS